MSSDLRSMKSERRRVSVRLDLDLEECASLGEAADADFFVFACCVSQGPSVRIAKNLKSAGSAIANGRAEEDVVVLRHDPVADYISEASDHIRHSRSWNLVYIYLAMIIVIIWIVDAELVRFHHAPAVLVAVRASRVLVVIDAGRAVCLRGD